MILKMNFLYPWFFILVEIKAEHISSFKMIVIKISQQLLLTTSIVFISVSDLHLDDILFSQIIDNQVGTSHTARTCLNIIVSNTIN